MITPEQLIAAEYRAHAIDNYVADHTGYFKWFYRAGVPAYSLQIVFWNFSKHFGQARSMGVGVKVSSEVRLYHVHDNPLCGDSGFRLEVSIGDEATIEQVEAFYERAYDALGCVPDLHNQ
jgi:hypothetical protein